MRGSRHDQRTGHGLFQRSLDRAGIRPGFHFDERVRVRQHRHGGMREYDKAVMLRVRRGVPARDGILRREHRTTYEKAQPLAAQLQRDRIPGCEAMGCGKLLLHQTALRVAGREQRSGAQTGPVDEKIPFVDFQGGLDVLPQILHIHEHGGTGLDLRHPVHVRDPLKIQPGKGGGVDPEVRQPAFFKIGLDRQIHQAPGAVQAGKDPGTQEAEQDHGKKLHGVFAHVPQQLSEKRRSGHHWISSTRMGCSLTVTSCTVPFFSRMIRFPSGAMAALCVIMTTVVL